ncbi:MAG: hypothetical protein ACHQD8_00625 [Chitinophagales bacterium]
MRPATFVIAFLLLLGISCTHAPMLPVQNPSSFDSLSLIGKWRWVKSVGGFSGVTLSPIPGENKFYVFNIDSSLLIISSNAAITDTVFSTYSVWIDSTYYIHGGYSNMMMFIPAFTMHYHYKFSGDSLILNEYASDGYIHWFVRM